MALPPLGELNIPLPVAESDPKLFCRKCNDVGVVNGITLNHMWQDFIDDGRDAGIRQVLPPDYEQLGLIRAFHVENVTLYARTEDQNLNFEEQPMAKVLNLHCNECRICLGWLLTDTVAGYGNLGEFYRDYLLLMPRLV